MNFPVPEAIPGLHGVLSWAGLQHEQVHRVAAVVVGESCLQFGKRILTLEWSQGCSKPHQLLHQA